MLSRLSHGFRPFGLWLLLATFPLAAQAQLRIDEARMVREVKARRPIGPTITRLEGRAKLFCWMRIHGDAALLEQVRASGNPRKIYHQWMWSVGGQRITLARIPLQVPEWQDLDALSREVAGRGFFDWHTWSFKSDLRHGDWIVMVLNGDGMPFLKSDGQPLQWEFYIE